MNITPCGKYRRYVNTESALRHIRGHLSSEMTLSKLVAEKPDLHKGKVTTFVPLTLNPERLLNFNVGHIASVKGLPHQCFVEYLTAFLNEDRHHVCVFEDAVMKPDQVPQTEREVMYTYQGEVYFVLHRDNVNSVDVSGLVLHVDYIWHFVGVFTSLAREQIEGLSNKTLTLDRLQSFADRAQIVSVSAYDGEGYLLLHI
jgi:hypothetical protein